MKAASLSWLRLTAIVLLLFNYWRPLHARELICPKKVCIVGNHKVCGLSCDCIIPQSKPPSATEGECGEADDYEYPYPDMIPALTKPGQPAQAGVQAQPPLQAHIPVPNQQAQSSDASTTHVLQTNGGGVQPGGVQQLGQNKQIGAGGWATTFPSGFQQTSEYQPGDVGGGSGAFLSGSQLSGAYGQMGGGGGHAAYPAGSQLPSQYEQIRGADGYGAYPAGSQISSLYGQMGAGGGYGAYPGGPQLSSSYRQMAGGGAYGAFPGGLQQSHQYGPSKTNLAIQGVSLGLNTLMTTLQMRNHMPSSMQRTYDDYDVGNSGSAAWPMASTDVASAATPAEATNPPLPPKQAPPVAPTKPLPKMPLGDSRLPSPPIKDLSPPPALQKRPPPVPPRGKPSPLPNIPSHKKPLPPPSAPPRGRPRVPPPVPPRTSSLPPPPIPPHRSAIPPPKVPRRGLSLAPVNRPGRAPYPSNRPLPMPPKRNGFKLKFRRIFKG